VARPNAARKVRATGVTREGRILHRSWLSWRHGQDGLREGLTRLEGTPRMPTKHNPRHGREERRTAISLPLNALA
jgi:hypothetical protein